MNQHSGETTSVWMQTATLPTPSVLDGNIGAEVCVVGAGIAGLSIAYCLARAGKSVVVVDDGPIASGETERTTAHLSCALDDRYYHLESLHGEEGARIAAASHASAIDEIEAIIQRESIECDFTRLDGFLFLPPGGDPEELRKELAAAQRAGLSDVTLLDRAPLDFWDSGPCLRFPRQGQFHVLKYMAGLVAAAQKYGVRLFGNTRVSSIEGGSPCTIETADRKRISCGAVAVATNTPINDWVTIHTKQAPYRTYTVGLRVPAGSVPKALYWDTAQDAETATQDHPSAYHYVRLQAIPGNSEELLIVGGEDHKTGQADDAEDRWARLVHWTRERFPMASLVDYRWSGQVMEPVDGVAYIGRNPGNEENLYIATGDSGHGITHGTIAGLIIRDLILERENAWADLYDPSRIRMKAAKVFLSENLNVMSKYTELLAGPDASALETLAPGSGIVVQKGASKVAAYRDPEGKLHQMSAICPHLKCVVHWNPGEKSWDCPCHGSRFNCMGEVMNGPALTNLEPATDPVPDAKAA